MLIEAISEAAMAIDRIREVAHGYSHFLLWRLTGIGFYYPKTFLKKTKQFCCNRPWNSI
ncbi:hypothetical protein [Paenibacillus taihuensis]|uniref:hypothetical protein n=1 Tax=Paenibacillus taihuensis TaxID=1156355 RepID=UPI0015F2675F|nr:hypothetical protein [Paenibacillus taihuensis]